MIRRMMLMDVHIAEDAIRHCNFNDTLENMMKCRKCKNNLFTIEVRTNCYDCPENGAWDAEEEGYIFDEEAIKEKGLIRDHVEEEGECNFDTAHGAGCWMVTCSKCGWKTNMPTIED